METMEQLGLCGIVPVVVIENAADAVPTARALMAGGVNVMEITFRTAQAPDAIRAVKEEAPEMLVGAGTVLNIEQARLAVNCGARFIVSPGFDKSLVAWCIANGMPVVPGCVTPTEIMEALEMGLSVLKFFPANVFGGLPAMKALSAPFGDVRFIPTGGVSAANLGEFAAAPFVHAVGGSWICAKADIAASNFERITALTREAVDALHGFALAHVGVNCADEPAASDVARRFARGFGQPVKDGQSSIFAGGGVEAMKSMFRGANGHIAYRANSLPRAISYLERMGFAIDPESARYKDGRMTAVYLTDEIGGFAVHLLQK